MDNATDNLTETELDTDATSQAGVGDNIGYDEIGDEAAQRLAEAESKLAYLAAEFENYKRQTDRRIEEARQRAKRSLLNDLLPALDNFALAQKYADKATDVNSLKIGLDFVAQQMESALQSAGVEAIPAKGLPFDPTLHDAIEEVADTDATSGTIVEEATRGYKLDGQVLRTSVVKVAK